MATTPLRPGWLVVDGYPLYHRECQTAGADAPAMVHVHGFGISGTYLEPTAALLAARFPTFVPDLPGVGRSMRPDGPVDIPRLAGSVVAYCDAVGIDRAAFVGNSLGCPVIIELANRYPDRVARTVLVSPAGGPNNQPLPRALGQMALDAPREPMSMVPVAVRDYLRFGIRQSLTLFAAMTRYDTIGSLAALTMPTLVIVGERDPLIRRERIGMLVGALPNIAAVSVSGAHALNFSRPTVIAALVEAHVDGRPLVAPPDQPHTVEPIGPRPAPPGLLQRVQRRLRPGEGDPAA